MHLPAFMGNCYSGRAGAPKSPKARPAARLATGDMVFLQEEGAKELYLLRTHDGWTAFSHCGFVMRRGSGAAGVLFCHADLVSGPDGVRRVAAEPLAELLASGHFTQAVARQLRVTLTPDQRDLLSEFVSLNLGKRSVTTTASVCMTAGSPLIPRGTERLLCSEFVALMLHLLGLAEPDMPASFTYIATAASGQLLHPPVRLDQGLGGSPRSPHRRMDSVRRQSTGAMPPSLVEAHRGVEVAAAT